MKILKSKYRIYKYDGRAPFSNYIEASMYFEEEAKLGKDKITVPLRLNKQNQCTVDSVVLEDSVYGNGYKLLSKKKDGKLEIRTYRKK